MLFEDSVEASMQSNAMIPDKSTSIDHLFQMTVSIGFIEFEFVRFHRSIAALIWFVDHPKSNLKNERYTAFSSPVTAQETS